MAIVGPTASGKSALGLGVARRTGATILSVDSMQVYRGMDIGTAKPSLAEREEITHEMIDVVSPDVDFTVPQFQNTARNRLETVTGPVIVVGGSGLHFRSVVDPMTFAPSDTAVRAEVDGLGAAEAVRRLVALDPEAGRHIDLENPRRVARALEIGFLTGRGPSERAATPEAVALRNYEPLHEFVGVGVDPGETISDRIDRRVDEMIAAGLVEEVSTLTGTLGRNASKAVGYAELIDATTGVDIDSAIHAIKANTLALARRQRTWFRRDPRIHWLAPDVDLEAAVAYCLRRWHP